MTKTKCQHSNLRGTHASRNRTGNRGKSYPDSATESPAGESRRHVRASQFRASVPFRLTWKHVHSRVRTLDGANGEPGTACGSCRRRAPWRRTCAPAAPAAPAAAPQPAAPAAAARPHVAPEDRPGRVGWTGCSPQATGPAPQRRPSEPPAPASQSRQMRSGIPSQPKLWLFSGDPAVQHCFVLQERTARELPSSGNCLFF